MSKPPAKDNVWLDKATRTTNEAMAIAEADLEAARKKTARLRELRLAKEAGHEATELEAKPARKKAKTKRRA